MTKIISWVEIPSTDFDRAVNFYNEVFKLNLSKDDFGNEKMACFPDGGGAIIYASGYKPSENGALVSFTSPDTVDETILRVEENGGKILQPKTLIAVDGRDYFAICVDSEGNKVGVCGK